MSYILECLNNILALMNKKLLWFYFIIIIIVFVSSVTSERKRDLNARTKISNVYTHKTAARLSDLNWLLRRKNILSNGLFNGAFQEEINYLQSSSIPKKKLVSWESINENAFMGKRVLFRFVIFTQIYFCYFQSHVLNAVVVATTTMQVAKFLVPRLVGPLTL